MVLIQGPFNPGTAGQISIGAPPTNNWSNQANILTSDDAYALSFRNAGTSNMLVGFNYGFSIPTDATILGIAASIEHKSSITNRTTDSNLYLLKDSNVFTLAGTNHASGQKWSTSDEIFTYGSATDLWGQSWSPSDINVSGLGLGLSIAYGTNGSSGFVDNMQLTVYYSLATSSGQCTLYIYGKDSSTTGCTLFECGHIPINSGMTLYEQGHIPSNSGMTLYVSGVGFSSLGVPLYIGDNGNRIDKGMTLYLKNPGSDSGMPLAIWGRSLIGDNPNSINGAIPRDGSIYLFINGQGQTANIPLFTSGNGNINNNIPLYTMGSNFLETSLTSGTRDWTISDLNVSAIAWLKADAIGSGDGTPISTWFDSTVNNNNFSQSTAANKPLYKINIQNGLPVVRFDGTNDNLSNPTLTRLQPYEFIFAGKPTQSDSTGRDWFTSTGFEIVGTNPTTDFMFAGGLGPSRNAANAWHVNVCLFSGVQSKWYLDGGTPSTADAGTGVFGPNLKIDGGIAPMDLGEFIILDYGLGLPEREKVEGYLAWKWGLQGNLPSSHTYKNSKPTVPTPPSPIGVTLVIPNVIANQTKPLNLYSHGF